MFSDEKIMYFLALLITTSLVVCAPAKQSTSTPKESKEKKMTLEIKDTVIGTGAEAKKNCVIEVHYEGRLENGTEFDSSKKRGQPFQFTLGIGQVIKGWDQGFDGMKVGGKRTLTIPADMGYGSRAAGSIPPNSTLIFDVELLNVIS